MSTIAIDPGKRGGIAYDLSGGETHSTSMPETPGDILDVLRTIRALNGPDVECYMEAIVRYAGKEQAGSHAIVYAIVRPTTPTHNNTADTCNAKAPPGLV